MIYGQIYIAARDGGSLAEEQAATCLRRGDLECRAGRAVERYAI